MSAKDYLKPVLVRSPGGRTGTSVMMELLSSSESIVFDRNHPYEVRLLSYFYRLSMLMFENKSDGWVNDLLVRGPLNMMGPIPTKTNLIIDKDTFRKQHFISSWSFFSNEFNKGLEGSKSAIYYAEKVPHDILEEIKTILDCKIIYLVRDPRAELSSIINFNKKRGSNGFGWKDNDTIDTYSERFILQRKRYFSMLNNVAKQSNTIVIKYESMITDVENICEKLSLFLNVKISDFVVKKKLNENTEHMTSGNPLLSIDKWKNDLPKKIIDNMNIKLNLELKHLQYIV